MDDVKDKVKGFMKKVNNPFSSSSSSKFKGQGHVLGSSSSTPPPTLPVHRRAAAAPPRKPSPSATPPISNNVSDPAGDIEKLVFECPVCARSFPSEAQVSAHVDSCLSEGKASEVETRVGEYVRGMPRKEAVEVVVRLLGNVAREPENEKFRRIRMGNPKIKEAVGDAKGGMELLECVGFRVEQEGDEVWAKMEEVPGEEGIGVIKEALSLLERWKLDDDSSKMAALNVAAKAQNEQEKIDRQIRVFFPVAESVAARIELPDSFYNLSAEEVKREAHLRKKKIEESQLLIPKSYKEKQAVAARRKYKFTVVRIQFPDGVVLQGVFLPWETTTSLYEFVSSALKEPCLEFELLQPTMPKPRAIPRFPRSGDRAPRLEEVDLVPSALLRFKPIETDSIFFTGLSNELLEASEPVTTSVL